MSQVTQREWRGRIAVSEVPPRDLASLAALMVAAVLVALGLGLAASRLERHLGGMVVITIPMVVGSWAWKRHMRRLVVTATASPPREVIATHRRMQLGEQHFTIGSARYRDGVLQLLDALGITRLVAPIELAGAAAIVTALGVPDEGARTIRVRGPIANMPVLGPAIAAFTTFASALATLLLIVPESRLLFGAILLLTLPLAVLSLRARRITLEDEGLAIAWLGRRRTILWSALQSIAVERGAIVVRERGGPVRRYRIALPLRDIDSTWQGATMRAESAAAALVERARTRSVAHVFE